LTEPELNPAPPQDPAAAAADAPGPGASGVARADGRPGPLRAADVVRALRPHQWVKNLLLFVPLLLAHEVDRASRSARLADLAVAFAAFCCVASAGYVLNDLWDRDVDRRHPTKRDRPLAAGRLSARAGALLAAGLYLAGLAASLATLPRAFTGLLVIYALLTALYSLWLKKLLLVDVFVLAGLYTQRVVAGGAAGGVHTSEWLLAFCIFFFLSLAFAKRYVELLRVQAESGAQIPGRAYRLEDLAVMEAVGPASGYLAVLVMALYVNSAKASQLYRSAVLLWLLCPVLLYWITRIWFLARRRSLTEDPILFALHDRVSLTCAALGVLLVLVAWVGVPGV
jgi:4-hydroxybenzoate polyprenyltransferase